MAAREIIAGIRSVQDAPVRRDGWRRGGVVQHARAGHGVLRGVHAGRGSQTAPAWLSISRQQGAGKRARVVVTAVIEPVAEGCPPLWAEILGINRGHTCITAGPIPELRASDRIDRAVR